jgi:FAD-dependent oxidoreductase domain-containing protein 1
MTSEHCDVLVVGGGVIGSAVAFFLSGDPDFDGTVTVVEKDPGYAHGATTRSAGSIRQQFSTAENIRMSLFGMQFLREARERLAVDGEGPEVGFVEGGYLFLASEAGMEILRDNHKLQCELGAEIALLDAGGLRGRFPWLDTTGIVGGALGVRGEGWFDPHALLHGFRRRALANGVRYLSDEVIGLNARHGRVERAQLAGGREIACGAVVNAAGIHGARVADWVGVSLPVRPRKRMIYVFDCRADVAGCPLTIDPTGVYFRPEGAHFICGVSPPADTDPDCEDFEPRYDLFEEIIWPTLAERVPAFEAIKLISAWVGHYDYNTFDQNVILGRPDGLENFYLANGFTGHGLQQSPAVGRALSELIVHGAYRSLDLSRFSPRRLVDHDPVIERNVV